MNKHDKNVIESVLSGYLLAALIVLVTILIFGGILKLANIK